MSSSSWRVSVEYQGKNRVGLDRAGLPSPIPPVAFEGLLVRVIFLEFPEFFIRSQSIAESHRGYFVLCLAEPSYLDRVN